MTTYDSKRQWAIDLDIYHGASHATDEQLTDYQRELQAALTANGNDGNAILEDSVIMIYGDAGGDNKRLLELFTKADSLGCRLEVDQDEDQHEMTGAEWDSLVQRLTLDSPTRLKRRGSGIDE